MADPLSGFLDSLKKARDSIEANKRAYHSHGLSITANSTALTANKTLVGQLGLQLRSMGGALGFADAAMRGMAKGVVVLTSILAEPIRMMQDLGNVVNQFVSLANPGAVQLFTLAMNDAMAVMGRMLTPVVKGMTIWIRAFGDSLARMEPVIAPIFAAMGQWLADAAVGASMLLDAMTPLIAVLGQGLAAAIRETAKSIAFFQGILIELINTITAMFGIQNLRGNPNADSKGASVRQTRVQSVEDFARSVFEKSLMGLFQGNQDDPVAIQKEILDAINQGRLLVQQIAAGVEVVKQWAQNPFVKVIQEFVERTKDLPKNPAGVLGGLAGMAGKAFIK